jgi:hypothetical protein
MATAKRFSIFPCSLTSTPGPTTVDLAQMQGFGVEPRPSVKRVYVGGSIDPKAHLLASADPQKPFSTRDLTTLLGAVSPLTGPGDHGLDVPPAGTRRRREVFLSGATHETFTCDEGARRHREHQRQPGRPGRRAGAVPAVRALRRHQRADRAQHGRRLRRGARRRRSRASFSWAPSITTGRRSKGILSHQVEFGLGYSPFRTSGNVYPKQGTIARRSPVMRLTTLKSDVDATVNMFLRAASGTLAFYLWKAVDAGDRVPVGDRAM